MGLSSIGSWISSHLPIVAPIPQFNNPPPAPKRPKGGQTAESLAQQEVDFDKKVLAGDQQLAKKAGLLAGFYQADEEKYQLKLAHDQVTLDGFKTGDRSNDLDAAQLAVLKAKTAAAKQAAEAQEQQAQKGYDAAQLKEDKDKVQLDQDTLTADQQALQGLDHPRPRNPLGDVNL